MPNRDAARIRSYSFNSHSPHSQRTQGGGSSRAQEPTGRRNPIARVVVRFALVFLGLVALPMGIGKLTERGAMPDVTAWMDTSDAAADVRVYDTERGSTATLPLNTYVLEVLAAGFTPDAPMASLEAVAVATRTYAVRAMTTAIAGSVAATHHADVTDSANLDLPLVTESQLQAEYPAMALDFITKLKAAIEATDGVIVTYQHKPIMAFMSEVSTGRTRSSEAALGERVPYLKAIACPDDAKSPAGEWSDTLSLNDIEHTITTKILSLSDLQLTRSSDGFVQTVEVGDKTVTGANFAALMGLQSTDFTWTLTRNAVIIHGNGRGSDLGMSLHEAQAMASRGASWQSIIRHFYPGAAVVSDKSWISTR